MIIAKQKKLVLNSLNLLLFLLLFEGCQLNKSNSSKKNLDLSLFQVSVVKDNAVIFKDIDGCQGKIYTVNVDTIYYNFGHDIDNLSEQDPTVFYLSNKRADTIKIDTSLFDPQKVIFTNKPNFDIDEYRKQNVFYDTISGFLAKIILPRRTSKGGVTGVYFDSLKSDVGGRLKFNFYAKNLNSKEQEIMLEMIHSIHFTLR